MGLFSHWEDGFPLLSEYVVYGTYNYDDGDGNSSHALCIYCLQALNQNIC